MLYEIKDRFVYHDENPKNGLFLSLYQTTHRQYPMKKQDLMVYKNLLKELEVALEHKMDRKSLELSMKAFYALEKDTDFWSNTKEGLAILANEDHCFVYLLNHPVQQRTQVSSSFHLKPLLYEAQFMNVIQVLVLSRDHFEIYEGNRENLSKIEFEEGEALSLKAVLGEQHSETYFTESSFAGVGHPAIHTSNTDKRDDYHKDTEKYFRFVDHYIFEHFSQKTKTPLLLVALDEHQSHFRELSHNPYLMENGLSLNGDSLDLNLLKSKLDNVLDVIDQQKNQEVLNAFEEASSEHKASTDLQEIIKSALEAKVETLLIEDQCMIIGKIDLITKSLLLCDEHPVCDDVLNDLAEWVLKFKGKVWILPKEQMPDDSGIAAIYRYD